jgi:acyl carrier protein phosphodiesterase
LNYLAHLYLSDDDPESLVGSLMGDFVKGRVDPDLLPEIRWGVLLHRRVDSFTDAHAVFRRSKRRIRPEFRRFAGILVDLYYDHFLARQWTRYSAIPLEDFARSVYRILQERQHSFPATMQRSMSYMVTNELLQSYTELQGIERALHGIEGRLKRPSRLREAIVDLEQNHQALAGDFDTFFPDLIRFVRQLSASREKAALHISGVLPA